jgi:pimeloyl-ACP methyl ester carboxylesterase
VGRRVGGFKTPEAFAGYCELYDSFVERHWPVEAEEFDIGTRFGETHVRRSGPDQGTPLVLLHPTTGSSLGWHSVIAQLSEDRTVYTPDTIGTAGRSIQTEPVRSTADLSSWLDQVLDALDVDRIHLGGYSEGGWLAAVHAVQTARPERLATLTLLEPGGAIERIPWRTLATLIFKAARTLRAKDKPRALRAFNRWMNGDIELNDDEIELVLFVFKNFRQRLPMPGRLPDDQLRKMTMPTLLMIAQNTRIFDPHKVAERAGRLLPEVTIDLITESGHGFVFQHSDRVTQHIVGFIDHTEIRCEAATDKVEPDRPSA